MIIKNGKEVVEIYHGINTCIEVYLGKRLIWQISRSCFGSGCWLNDKPWDNEEDWRNN